MKLSTSITRVLAGDPQASVNPSLPVEVTAVSPTHQEVEAQAVVHLEPEVRTISSGANPKWTAYDLVVSVETIKLHLYDGFAQSEPDLKDHGIARFALNDNTLRLKILSDGAGEAQVILRSFIMSNTRPGSSKFREIIPAAQHNRNQFMLLYTMSGAASGAALAVLTVDSPKIIFAIDPVISLLEFFTTSGTNESLFENPTTPVNTAQTEGPQLDFRVDLHDVSISVIENDADPESQAIKLYINQILLSKQVNNDIHTIVSGDLKVSGHHCTYH